MPPAAARAKNLSTVLIRFAKRRKSAKLISALRRLADKTQRRCRMSRKVNQHVVPRGKGWAVVPSGRGGRAVSTHRTQGAAIRSAVPRARSAAGEVVIHRPNGQIRDANSYGSDPFPPQG